MSFQGQAGSFDPGNFSTAFLTLNWGIGPVLLLVAPVRVFFGEHGVELCIVLRFGCDSWGALTSDSAATFDGL